MAQRTCYAMSGTDVAYAATRPYGTLLGTDCRANGLRACYAMSGTDVAYSSTGLCDSGSDAVEVHRGVLTPPYYLLPTTYYLLPTTYYLPPTAYCISCHAYALTGTRR
eukprot:1061942-Rhodomonas_salina.2